MIKQTKTGRSARPRKTPSSAQAPQSALPASRHVVCFWKQSDLGLYGRRPDRWIAQWEQDPTVEQVLVFEAPAGHEQLRQWLRLATSLDRSSASEFQLLLDQWLAKRLGRLDSPKVRYLNYLAPEGEAAAGAAYLRWVLGEIRAAGLVAPTVMLWPACYVNAALIEAIAPAELVVDLVDDQRLFPGNDALAGSITAQYRTWIAAADRVLSNSAGLIESFQAEFGRSIEHLPNDRLPMMPDRFGAIPALAAQAAALKSSRPVVGYVGNMRGRIDTALLVEVMRRRPDWDFWFVGQTHGSAFHAATKDLPNVRFWGALSQGDARTVMERFDVGLIPFRQDALVRSMSPIKVGAYRQAGLAVVSLWGQSADAFERELGTWLGLPLP